MGQPIERCCWLVLKQPDVVVLTSKGRNGCALLGLALTRPATQTPSAKLMQLLGTRVMTVIVMNFDVEC
jgi:hypothetical protein